jgi:two-component system cell cycle sensor histidine kinase/response regulator CckA
MDGDGLDLGTLSRERLEDRARWLEAERRRLQSVEADLLEKHSKLRAQNVELVRSSIELSATKRELEDKNLELEGIRKDLRGQNFNIVRKSIELSSVLRQFEDRNYELWLYQSRLAAAMASLRESEERYRHLADNATDVIWTATLDLRMSYVSPSVARLQGFSAEEAMTQTLSEMMSPGSAKIVKKMLARAVAWASTASPEEIESRTAVVQVELTRKDGSTVWAEVTTRFLLGRDGRVEKILGISRDISERREAEANRVSLERQVQHAQKLESLGVLAGGVAHDFNNLLVGMLGHSSLALSKLPAESPARANIGKVVQAAERAADLSRQMLAYSGRGHFVVQTTDLGSLVRENLHLFEASIPKGVRLEACLAETPAVIEADVGQVQQVVMNLVLNGAEAIGERPGSVTVVTGFEELTGEESRYSRFTAAKLKPGRYVLLDVRDDGAGMDVETLARVFEPFFTTKFVGRGLGLAAVLGIIRGHGGGIDVQSVPGSGTTFSVVIPAAEGAAPVSRVAAAEGKVKGTILLIDDEEVVRETASEMLAAEDLEVLTADSGAAGIALYRDRRAEIGLIILDFSMPGMGGEETYRELRKIDPDVRVVLSSGFGEDEVTRRFAGLGLQGFIQKPYNPNALLEEIQRHLSPLPADP